MKAPWLKLWNTPAAEVNADALLAVIARLAEAGKLREAAKLRAYLRAAYSAGMKARRNALALPALRNLRITANPASDLAPIEGANKARERALSRTELCAYWGRINALLPGTSRHRGSTERTPPRELKIARARLKEVKA